MNSMKYLLQLVLFLGVSTVFPKCFISEPSRKYIDCSHKNLTGIPQDLPNDSIMLDFNTNIITDIPPRTFKNMSKVIWIDLSNNRLHRIQRDSLIGLSNLISLNLSHNFLNVSSFEMFCFRPIRRLQTLRIEGEVFNEQDRFPDEMVPLKNLETLELAAFVGMIFDKRFESWRRLKMFVSLNSQSFILKNDTFAGLINSPLQQLSIKIEHAETGALVHVPKLKILDTFFGYKTSNTAVQNVFKMVSIFKTMNRISMTRTGRRYSFKLTGKQLQNFNNICLKQLSLENMNIIGVDGPSFKTFAEKSDCLEWLNLSGNLGGIAWAVYAPLFKNLKYIKYCSINPFPVENQLFPSQMNLLLPKMIEDIEVENVNSLMPLTNMNFYRGRNLKILRLTDFVFSDCTGIITGLGNLRSFDISGNRCGRLNELILRRFPRLESFTAARCDLGTAFRENKNAHVLLHSLMNLKHVDISFNGLRNEHFPESTFKDQYTVLEWVDFSHNYFQVIPLDLFKFQKLMYIDLSYNQITTFKPSERQKLDQLVPGTIKILVQGNPFQCMCSNVEFLKWAKQFKILDLRNVNCRTENGDNSSFVYIFQTLESFEKHCHDKLWLTFSLSISTAFAFTVVLVAVYFRYRAAFQYIYLKMKLKVKKYEELDGSIYLHDVFICYNHNDASWVADFHRKLMERGLRTCLDAKDFIAGDPIAENILRAIDSSRKIIFIITTNFLNSTWGRYEMEITRMHAFQEGRDNMVIVILKDNIPIHKMPRSLKQFWYKVTCIKWFQDEFKPFQSEDIFFENVFNALSTT